MMLWFLSWGMIGLVVAWEIRNAPFMDNDP
jgi:hypothetical protein